MRKNYGNDNLHLDKIWVVATHHCRTDRSGGHRHFRAGYEALVMKKILFFTAFALFFFATPPPAHADTPTPTTDPNVTPTMTSKPLVDMSTPTPASYNFDGACPDGEPAGWLTVTPSSLWLQQCTHCLITPVVTSTPPPPTPVPTWDGIGASPTPAPTSTPTLHPTLAATPPVSLTCNNTCELSCEQLNDWTVRYDLTGWEGSYCSYNFPEYAHISDLYILHEGHIRAYGTTGNDYWSWWFKGAALENSVYTLLADDHGPPTGTTPYWVDVYWEGEFHAGDIVRIDQYGKFGWYKADVWESGYIIFSAVPLTSQPTPTPAPTPSLSYCSAVDGGVDDGEIFGYTGLEFGSIYCADLLPFHVSILGLDITIPHFAHICLQNVSAGDVYIFGMRIPLDSFLYALGVSWAIRNLFVS